MSFNWRDHLKVHPAADLFPLMSETDPAALKDLAEDIRRNGLQAPIVLWAASRDKPDWLLVDGRNRLDALALSGSLGIDDEGQLCRIMPDGKRGHISAIGHHPPCDPYAHAVSLNIHRRHLTAEQKRELIAKLLKANPEKSDRQFAKETGVSHPHVAKVRKELEKSGDVETVSTRTDTKGRKQPACREKIRRAEAITRKHAAETRKRREDYHEYMDEKISRFARKLIQLDAALARELWEIISEGGDPHQLMDDLQIGIAPHNNDDGLDIPDYLKRAAP
jgi:DNA-binding transcriptional regulator YhcF (GntR family)